MLQTMSTTRMPLKIVRIAIPLQTDSDGAIRISHTRITLDTVVTAFNQGLSAEEIVSKFPSLKLGDVYAVIGYYLRRQQEIDTYLHQEEDSIRKRYPEVFETAGIRERLIARQTMQ